MITCGWVVHALQSSNGDDYIRSYRTIFFAYAVVGIMKFALACALSSKVEAIKEARPVRNTETTPLLGEDHPNDKKPKPRMSLLPSISRESRLIVVNLCLLFALDSFASGLASL